MLPLRRAAQLFRSVSPQASPRAMVSSSCGECDRDAAAESTAEQKVNKKQANSNQEEAAVAVAPSDPQKVKQEERPEKEARKETRSEHEVRKRKPAVAATSQSETVIDETARLGTDAQPKDCARVGVQVAPQSNGRAAGPAQANKERGRAPHPTPSPAIGITSTFGRRTSGRGHRRGIFLRVPCEGSWGKHSAALKYYREICEHNGNVDGVNVVSFTYGRSRGHRPSAWRTLLVCPRR